MSKNKIIDLIPDDDFGKIIFWVIDEIKKEILATQKGYYVDFEYQNIEDYSQKDQNRALRFLEKNGAIKIFNDKYSSLSEQAFARVYNNVIPSGSYIKIIQPAFDELVDVCLVGKRKLFGINFDPETSILNFKGIDIEISKTKNNNPHYLLKLIFEDKEKEWFYDEIWEDPYFKSENDTYDKKRNWRKIYNAGYSINEKVAKNTETQDFLKVTKTSVSINKKYIN